MEKQIANSQTHPVTIRFPHVDNAGIIFYPRYVEILLKHFPDLPLFDMPSAFSMEFRKPNRLGDRINLILDRAPGSDDWSIAGQMAGEEYFAVRPLPTEQWAMSTEVRRERVGAFETTAAPVGEWTLNSKGYMYLSRYFEYVNVAVEKWFEATLELPFYQLHVDRKVAIPTVRFTTKCRLLPQAGDNVKLQIVPVRIGSRSITSRILMFRDNECLVETEQVIVFVQTNESGFHSIEIPKYVREAFAAQLEAPLQCGVPQKE